MSAPRYRCTACGNLTRFDVTSVRRTRAFHHFTVGGALEVESEDVLSESIEDVSCRWCGHGRAVELIGPGSSDPSGGLSPSTGSPDVAAGAGDPPDPPGVG